ncbi:MAG: rhomboid family intramembrane serine protease [Desulfobacterales bacterium]|nr:rhomboid family intramembrane serine protease [Desulfobacterales bacterium]
MPAGTGGFLRFISLPAPGRTFFTSSSCPTPDSGIGASGAIFGLMGAYLLLYPGGRIRTLVFISFVPLWPRIRAIWVVLYFFGIQIIPAIEILMGRADYRVNYWAHLGGFFSAVFILLFVRPEAYSRYMSEVSV